MFWPESDTSIHFALANGINTTDTPTASGYVIPMYIMGSNGVSGM